MTQSAASLCDSLDAYARPLQPGNLCEQPSDNAAA